MHHTATCLGALLLGAAILTTPASAETVTIPTKVAAIAL